MLGDCLAAARAMVTWAVAEMSGSLPSEAGAVPFPERRVAAIPVSSALRVLTVPTGRPLRHVRVSALVRWVLAGRVVVRPRAAWALAREFAGLVGHQAAALGCAAAQLRGSQVVGGALHPVGHRHGPGLRSQCGQGQA